MSVTAPAWESFDELLGAAAPRLRRAFVARYGVELGTEALADTIAWAWEHRTPLLTMTNPVGYLYRVGQSSVRAQTRRTRRLALLAEEWTVDAPAGIEPNLHLALEQLTEAPRAAVVLVHAHGYSYADAADTLDITVAALRNHVHRGMSRLRRQLEH